MALAETTPDVRDTILDTAQRLMGRKGFSAVGLSEILADAQVPKGSFYHYFRSKDAFGEAMLERYFARYLAGMDETLRRPGLTMADRLMIYWEGWRDTQNPCGGDDKCLAVKLGAEVADLSEAMRLSLARGTAAIVERLARAVAAGVAEGSLDVADPEEIAGALYDLWLGASVMAKITRDGAPFETAMAATRRLLTVTPQPA